MSDDHDEHLRAFLLGRLDEATAAAVEARVFEDDEEAERVAAVEAELYDAYALGELSADDRARLERRGLATPEGRRRLGVARALIATSAAHPAEVGSAQVESAPSPTPRAPAAAAPEEPTPWLARLAAWLSPPRAALGLALAAAVLLLLRPASTPTPTPLVPDAVRAAGAPARAALTSPIVRLELDLDGEAPRTSYRVVLLARGAERWRSEALLARGPAVDVDVPTGALEPGIHTVRLEADGELVATYTVELTR